ncbi:hypothetical protein WCD74_19680 [Actinomycetospora sp. OC33-EN08]|uniref:Uncharacterized protein n=1 Tax=Actinomycetospora aurantiaca TaxID=3129233 RepID=A0ABU8MST8_9PSEU
MSSENQTDRSTVVPPAAPLTGVNTEPDQPEVSEVFPAGEAASEEHLEPNAGD